MEYAHRSGHRKIEADVFTGEVLPGGILRQKKGTIGAGCQESAPKDENPRAQGCNGRGIAVLLLRQPNDLAGVAEGQVDAGTQNARQNANHQAFDELTRLGRCVAVVSVDRPFSQCAGTAADGNPGRASANSGNGQQSGDREHFCRMLAQQRDDRPHQHAQPHDDGVAERDS